MKTENVLYTSVFINAEEITVALDFDYHQAKETMIQMLSKSFQPETDDGLIFKHGTEGTGAPIFNFRAYLNQEPDRYEPPLKSNQHLKVFFSCPYCACKEGKIGVDEDSDVIYRCNDCHKIVPFY